MSGIVCTCDSQVKHLGLPGCSAQIGIPKRLIWVPTFKTDGTLNYIDTSTAAIDTSAYWNGLQYNTDPSARYFPLPADIESVETDRSETVYQTFESGRKIKVRDGVRSFKGFYPEMATPMIDKLDSKGCAKHSIFIVDHYGNLVGEEKSSGKLYPLQIADNSMDAFFKFANDSTVSGVPIMLEFAQNVRDAKISYIPASEIGIDLFTQFNGKLDTSIAQVAANRGATTFQFDMYLDYGNVVKKKPVEDLVAADLLLYNVTDSASVTISTLVESTTVPGRYTVTFATQTVTDILRLSLNTSDVAKGYDGEQWEEVEIALQ